MASIVTMEEQGPRAQYFHSTLYRFSVKARAAVLTAFGDNIGNIPANCSYDAVSDIFSMDCPSSSGDLCNETLRIIISKYLAEELEAATNEERRPQVHRFLESRLVWEGGDDDQEDVEESNDGPPPPVGRPVVEHTVIVKDTEGKLLKFFSMPQLPDGFVQRALCIKSPKTEEIFGYSLTCRAVRWKAGEGYVFNGRDGIADVLDGGNTRQSVPLPDFPELSDNRDQATLDMLDRKEEDAPPATWEHVGDAPAVQMWLQGVGETRQVEPNEAAEPLPKATKQMLAAEEMHGIGRTRVPKGYVPRTTEQVDSSDDEEATTIAGDKPNFDSMFAARPTGGPTHTGDSSDSDTDSNKSTESSSTVKVRHAASFNDMLSTHGAKPPPQRTSGWSTAANADPRTPIRTGQSLQSRTNTPAVPSPASTSAASPSTAAPPSTVPDPRYPEFPESKYAVVDTIGLAGHVAHTAAYELQNYTAKEVKAKCGPLIARVKKSRMSQAGTDLGGTSLSGESSAFPVAARTAQSSSVPPAWEQNIPRVECLPAGLIDTSVRLSLRSVPVPPGLENKINRSHRPTAPPTVRLPELGSLVDAADIGLMDSSPPRTTTVRMSGYTLQPVPSSIRPAVDDDVVVDRLGVFPPDSTLKRKTMNQKAGKNVNSKKNKTPAASGVKPKVQLEMPDPLPAPRVKKVEPAPELHTSKQRVSAAQAPAKIDYKDFGRPFSQLLLEMVGKDANEDDGTTKRPKLVAQVGLLLSCAEPLGKQEATGVDDVQKLLNDPEAHPTTSFFPRLTTSTSDAEFMMDLAGVPAGQAPDLVYEILIKDAAGWPLKCTFTASDKTSLRVETIDKAVGYLFMHYPVHVWDVRMSLLKAGVDRISPSPDAIEQFVSSMKTEHSVPSFRAYIPHGQFTVEWVLSHRSFESVENGITSRVTEKQHFAMENIRGARHNFLALALSKFDAVEEQRLWWEVSLEGDLARAIELQAKAEAMLLRMDGVGLSNAGPWERPVRAEKEDGRKESSKLYDDLGRMYLAEKRRR